MRMCFGCGAPWDQRHIDDGCPGEDKSKPAPLVKGSDPVACAYEQGYLDALRKVEQQLQGSGAFNCGSYRGFEYPVHLVTAMIKETTHDAT